MRITIQYPNNSYESKGDAVLANVSYRVKLMFGKKDVHIVPDTASEARRLAYALLTVAEELATKEERA